MGWAAEKGLAYSFGKPFSQQKFPDLVNWVQEAEIKHARVAMLAALGYPVAEVFHPLWGGSINEPSLIAFQATPLQTFWPIVIGAIGLIESASYISDMKGTAEEGRYYAFNEQRGVAGDIGFDPLGFAAKGAPRRGAYCGPHRYAWDRWHGRAGAQHGGLPLLPGHVLSVPHPITRSRCKM